MTQLRNFSLAAVYLISFILPFRLHAEEPKSPGPEFSEVYSLLREHLAGTSETELNRAAVQGLLSSLGPKVMLVGPDASTAGLQKPLISKTNLFDGQIGYLRISRVAEGLPQAVTEAYNQLSATNDLSGLILDLRFADGHDYAAAAATAELFLQKEKPLLDWGTGVVQSKEKPDALKVPVAVMVNHQTAGAAEALAGVLRQTGTGLVLGSRTAGQAMIAQEYPLKGGERLRISTAPVHLGDGSELSTDGIKPDINVTVAVQAERSYFEDAFNDPANTNLVSTATRPGTNSLATTARPRRTRFNEAELVRERKEGFSPDADTTDAGPDADSGVVRDPVLARAVDVLKGLALVRRARS